MAEIVKAVKNENVAETLEQYVREAPEEMRPQVRAMLDVFGGGDSEKAEEMCREILQKKPDYPYVQTVYGVCLFEKSRFEDA